MMCTMIYGEHESAGPLGSDFRPGARYTLDVNGTRQPFVAGEEGGKKEGGDGV